jgi:hypothetical protein
MRGTLESLHRAVYIKGPSGPRDGVRGTLGVFAYGGNEWKGDMCLFKPDDPEALGGRVKLRPGPGVVDVEGATLRLTVKGENGSYAWELVEAIADPEEERAFLDFAAANDRIIGHLLDGARFYEQG